MLEKFYDMHPRKGFHKSIYGAVLFFGLFFCSLSIAEPMMKFDDLLSGLDNTPYNQLNSFKEMIGYDEAIRNEKRDGLLVIDFRELKAPPFATQWPGDDGWSFRPRNRSTYFSWAAKSVHAAVSIMAFVHDNYEDPQQWILSRAQSSNMSVWPWTTCSKKIGTVCAKSEDTAIVFFAYKNVRIDIKSFQNDPGHEDFPEVVAEWLFEALKAAPLRPFPSSISR
jgi:hypothetical protein